MKKKMRFILTIIMLISFMKVNTLGVSLNLAHLDFSSRIEELKFEINGYEDEVGIIEQIESEIEKMQLEIEHYDNNIEIHLNEIETINNQMCVMESEEKKISEKINDMNDEIQDERAIFYKRARDMYINGNIFYIEILLKSEGISEFIDCIGILQSVIKYNEEMISNLINKENDLKHLKIKYYKDLASYKDIKAKKEDKINEFEKLKEQQKNIITKLQEKREYYISILPGYREIMNNKQKEIENVTIRITALATQRENEFYSRGESTISPKDIVACSAQFLGKPYEWGKVGPDSFDCSGFVKYVYSYFGIELKRTTYEQCNQGIYVEKESLREGDLVFFGYGAPHHVGIYVGNDCYIHAPTAGEYIRVSHLSRNDYFIARRVLSN